MSRNFLWAHLLHILIFITKIMKAYHLFSKIITPHAFKWERDTVYKPYCVYSLSQEKVFSHNVSFWITDNTPPHINIQVKNNKRKLLPITFDHACFLSSNFCFELPILWRNWKSLVSHPSVANGKSTHIIYHFFDSIRDHIKTIVVQIY